VLVLVVLISIVFQISIGTMTDARVGRNDVTLTLMDKAISSSTYDIDEMLVADSEADADSGGAADPTGGAAAGAMGGGESGGETQEPSDSRKDEWASPQRTEINGIQLRILVEAENAKYNVLNMLVDDEDEAGAKEAEEAFMRVVRIIDTFREGTDDDVSEHDAEEMALAMKSFMLEHQRSGWQRPELLTNDDQREGYVLPMTLRDFLVLEPFHEYYFRCYRDSSGRRVHSLDQFLTVWSSPGVASDVVTTDETTGSSTTTAGPSSSGSGAAAGAGSSAGTGAGSGSSGDGASGGESASSGGGDQADGGSSGTGDTGGGSGSSGSSGDSSEGYGVNINLAPAAVLKSLVDDRDVPRRFWDDVIEYRNLEEENEDDNATDQEPLYDEFGEEVLERQAFESLDELSEVRSWDDLDSTMQERVRSLLVTQSDVFSIYITARRNTSADEGFSLARNAREQARLEEDPSGALVRTVRMVVWRRSTDDGVVIVPIIPWEVMSYSPFQVEDFPEDEY